MAEEARVFSGLLSSPPPWPCPASEGRASFPQPLPLLPCSVRSEIVDPQRPGSQRKEPLPCGAVRGLLVGNGIRLTAGYERQALNALDNSNQIQA